MVTVSHTMVPASGGELDGVVESRFSEFPQGVPMPVTFTTQVHPAAPWTMICWAPVEVMGVMA